MKIFRNCPICNVEMLYKKNSSKNRSIKDKTNCMKCAGVIRGAQRIGENHPMYGKQSAFKGKKHTTESKLLISKNHADISGENNPMFNTNGGMYNKTHTQETKNKIGDGNRGKIVSKETREKISKIKLEYYKNNISQSKGRKHNIETKRKMRISAIKRIEDDKYNGNQFYPRYNKNSIIILQNYATKHNLDIQHAENGGEYYIKELGYWVDAYDINKNIVVEYYEKSHKYTTERDKNRENEIKKYLGCDFIIINE